MSEHKLDIKDVLHNIDMKNVDWFSTLSPELQESFNPFVVMQFLNGGREESNLELTNLMLNKNFSEKSKNKELFYRLACVVGTGTKQYHPYTKPPKASRKKTTSKLVELITLYTQEKYTEEEAILLFKKNSKFYDENFWTMIAESFEWSKDDVKKLVAEIKTIY